MAMRLLMYKWVPREFTGDLREMCGVICEYILPALKEEQTVDFGQMMTGDDSWFSLHSSPDYMSAFSPNETTTSEKFILIVFGPLVIEWLPQDASLSIGDMIVPDPKTQ
jgi:hypothetical protein